MIIFAEKGSVKDEIMEDSIIDLDEEIQDVPSSRSDDVEVIEGGDLKEEEATRPDILSGIAAVEQDVFNSILNYLDPLSLSHVEATCHNLYNCVQFSNIWKRKYEAARRLIEQVERNQKIELIKCHSNCRETIHGKKVLLRIHNLERNLGNGRCKKGKVSFYDLVGFNGDGLEIKASDCSSVFVHEEGIFNKTYIHDLHSGAQNKVVFSTYPGFSVTHCHLEDGVLAVLRQPKDNDEEEDAVFQEISVLETYKQSFNQYFYMSAQSNIIPKSLTAAIKIQLVDNAGRIFVPVKDDANLGVKLYIYQIIGKQIEESSVRSLTFPCCKGQLPSRFETLLQSKFLVWHFNAEYICVWSLQSDDSLPCWSKDSSAVTRVRIPPVTISCFDLSWPWMLIGGSDGRCQVWQCEQDRLVRTLEHHIDSGHNVGWRQVTVGSSSNIIVSLTECGWLLGWDKARVFSQDKALTNDSLRLWKINTKHETPIVSFLMNSSRIVSLERHQMTSDWDVRMFLVVRDFWKYQDSKGSRNHKLRSEDKHRKTKRKELEKSPSKKKRS